MISIAVTNQKGGVGKTTTAVNLAAGMTLGTDLRILLIDLDSQGNVADSLGLDQSGDLDQWVGSNRPLKECIVEGRPRLDIVRADKTTADLKTKLAAMNWREFVLRDKILDDAGAYDVVIMDCAPSVDVLHIAALVASDYVCVPTSLNQFAVKGVVEILRSIAGVHRATNARPELAGIIPTFYDRVTTETHEQLANLVTTFENLVWPVVPMDVACRQAARAGKTIYELDPHCRAWCGNDVNGVLVGGYKSVLQKVMELVK